MCSLSIGMLPTFRSQSSGFTAVPLDHLEWEGFPVKGIAFEPFHSSPSLHEDILPGVGVG